MTGVVCVERRIYEINRNYLLVSLLGIKEILLKSVCHARGNFNFIQMSCKHQHNTSMNHLTFLLPYKHEVQRKQLQYSRCVLH